MIWTVSIHEAAEMEIDEAVGFYDLESPGLGATFIDEIQRSLRMIVEFPDASPSMIGTIRKKNLIRFPYWLVYSIRASEIRILAVAHQKKRPNYWRSRQ